MNDKKHARAKQLLAVWRVMRDGKWHSLDDMAAGWSPSVIYTHIPGTTAGTTASISARIRDLRKPQYGGHAIKSKPSAGGGSWSYRMVK